MFTLFKKAPKALVSLNDILQSAFHGQFFQNVLYVDLASEELNVITEILAQLNEALLIMKILGQHLPDYWLFIAHIFGFLASVIIMKFNLLISGYPCPIEELRLLGLPTTYFNDCLAESLADFAAKVKANAGSNLSHELIDVYVDRVARLIHTVADKILNEIKTEDQFRLFLALFDRDIAEFAHRKPFMHPKFIEWSLGNK